MTSRKKQKDKTNKPKGESSSSESDVSDTPNMSDLSDVSDDDLDEESFDLDDVIDYSRNILYGIFKKNKKLKKKPEPKCILDHKGLFPPFSSLPNKTELFEYYFASDGSSFALSMRNSWMFIGEISSSSTLFRPRCILKSMYDEKSEVVCAFYTSSKMKMKMSSLLSNIERGGSGSDSFIPNGSVMLILYAETHNFLD